MQSALLERYILEQIHLIERNSYYNQSLLEEGIIGDYVKAGFKKVKDFFVANPEIEKLYKEQAAKAEKSGKVKRANKFNKKLDDLHATRFKRQASTAFIALFAFIYVNETNKGLPAEKAAEAAYEQTVESYRGNDTFDVKGTPLEEVAEDNGFKKTEITDQQLLALYAITGTSPEDFSDEDSSSKNASQNQLDEMFFNYMEGAFKDYNVSDFNDMSKEDFDYIVDQYEDFLNENTFRFTEDEYNQAMALAFLLKSSENYDTGSNKIKDMRGRLTAVRGALRTIDVVARSLPDPSELPPDITQDEVEQRVSDRVNGQIVEVEKLRDALVEKYNNPENEEYYDESNQDKIAMYDDMISQIENRFKQEFGFELMEKR
jgi:hypothetical protein